MVKKNTVWMFLILILLSACNPTTTELVEPDASEPESALTEVTTEPAIEPTSTTAPDPTATEEIVPTPTEDLMSDGLEDAIPFNLGESFALGGGKTAVLTSGDLTLKFTEVLEDSRCPKDVNCFWEGQARILITAEQTGQAPLELEFNTNLATEGATDTLDAYEFVVQLEQLNPYPRNADNPITFAAYQAQLVVTQP